MSSHSKFPLDDSHLKDADYVVLYVEPRIVGADPLAGVVGYCIRREAILRIETSVRFTWVKEKSKDLVPILPRPPPMLEKEGSKVFAGVFVEWSQWIHRVIDDYITYINPCEILASDLRETRRYSVESFMGRRVEQVIEATTALLSQWTEDLDKNFYPAAFDAISEYWSTYHSGIVSLPNQEDPDEEERDFWNQRVASNIKQSAHRFMPNIRRLVLPKALVVPKECLDKSKMFDAGLCSESPYHESMEQLDPANVLGSFISIIGTLTSEDFIESWPAKLYYALWLECQRSPFAYYLKQVLPELHPSTRKVLFVFDIEKVLMELSMREYAFIKDKDQWPTVNRNFLRYPFIFSLSDPMVQEFKQDCVVGEDGDPVDLYRDILSALAGFDLARVNFEACGITGSVIAEVLRRMYVKPKPGTPKVAHLELVEISDAPVIDSRRLMMEQGPEMRVSVDPNAELIIDEETAEVSIEAIMQSFSHTLKVKIAAARDIDFAVFETKPEAFDAKVAELFEQIKKTRPDIKLVKISRSKGYAWVTRSTTVEDFLSWPPIEFFPSSLASICSHHVAPVRALYGKCEKGEGAASFYLTASALRATHGMMDTYNYFASRKSYPQKIIAKYILRGYHLSPFTPEAILRAMRDYVHHCLPDRPEEEQSAAMLCNSLSRLVPPVWYLTPMLSVSANGNEEKDPRENPGSFLFYLKNCDQFISYDSVVLPTIVPEVTEEDPAPEGSSD